MNNYCIHLKKRKNKPYCNVLKEEIPFSQCRECGNKKYKTKNKENSSYKKSDIMMSNSSQIRNSAVSLQNSAKNLQKTSKKVANMKNKSNKLAKLERDRFSVFTDDKNKCMFCPATTNLTWHEIYAGRNRRNSMIYGFCLRMCLNCHEEKQEDVEFNEYWHRQAQSYWEENIGSRDEFLRAFRRNYLK